jgi:hypothetical protein
LAVYRHIPRGEIIDALVHIRDLHRKITPSNERGFRAHERREAATRDLLSNLPRTMNIPRLIHCTSKALREDIEGGLTSA